MKTFNVSIDITKMIVVEAQTVEEARDKAIAHLNVEQFLEQADFELQIGDYVEENTDDIDADDAQLVDMYLTEDINEACTQAWSNDPKYTNLLQ